MKKLVELEVEGGPPVYVEVDTTEEAVDEALAGFEPARRSLARGPDAARGGRWRDALEQVRPAIEQMIDVFRTVATPEEIAVELSLKLNTKVNAFVFSSDGEATVKLALKWKNEVGGGGGRGPADGGGGGSGA